MKKKRRLSQTFSFLAGVMLVMSALMLTPIGVIAQEAAMDLFTFIKKSDLVAMGAAQSKQLAIYQAEPTTKNVQVVNLQMDILQKGDKANLNLFANQSMQADVVRLDKRSPQDYTWYGSSSQSADDAVLVIQDGSVVGTIRSGGKLYRVRPLEGGLHALILVDETKFPPEHPPEFEEIEQDTKGSSFRWAPEDLDLEDACTEYTVIIAYTAGAKAQVGNIDGLIQLAIDETNQGYKNSKINTSLKLVHKYQTSYTESGNMATDRNRFRIKNDNFMDEVHGLRDEHDADIAILITKSGNYCGIAAAIMADVDTAFAVVGQNCATGYYSFAHEIGHLQGARHNPEADPTNTPFPYGHGYYYQPGKWRTIMSYNCPGGCTRLKYWSNPNVKYGGVAMGTATHNNTKVLNQTACTVANFKTTSAVSGGPLAFGTILSNGNRYSGTPNWTSTYNATYKRYEISIQGESYYYLRYTTNVTPAGDVRFCRSSSVGGKLLVYCYDKNGNTAASRFAFATFKNP
jgi:hypothetical protein